MSIEWKRGQFTWNTTYDDVIVWNGSSQTLQLPQRRHLHGRPTSQIRMITITFVFLEKKLAGRINSFNAIQSLHTDLKSIPKLISIQEKKPAENRFVMFNTWSVNIQMAYRILLVQSSTDLTSRWPWKGSTGAEID